MRPSAKVYRTPTRNSDGDPVDADGKVVRVGAEGTYVGEIKNIMMGGLSASPSRRREESSDTSGQVGIPNVKNQIKVRFGDRLVIDGIVYRVISKPQWDYPHGLTGTKPAYHWVQIEGTVG